MEEILNDYRKHMDTLAASMSAALQEVGDPNRKETNPAQRYLIASCVTAIEQLADSLSTALKDVADNRPSNFEENARHFMSGLSEKSRMFKQIAKRTPKV